ncbi:MAG TPA: hypothetical protein EYG18_07865 [Micavibrio sp.]|nr:hypothetical protein [Alphaproteobacteria bacterium]HIL29170.1 hypothetical protein [Micavibrio sp.]
MTKHVLHTAVLAIGTVALANVAYAGGNPQTIPGNNPEGVAQYVVQSEKAQHKKSHEAKSKKTTDNKAAHEKSERYNN